MTITKEAPASMAVMPKQEKQLSALHYIEEAISLNRNREISENMRLARVNVILLKARNAFFTERRKHSVSDLLMLLVIGFTSIMGCVFLFLLIANAFGALNLPCK